MANVALGSLTPVTSPNSTMAVLVAKPSVGTPSQKDLGLVASTAFATATGLTAAVAAEATARDAAIAAAVSGISGGGSGGTASYAVDATYTASGAIDPTKTAVLFNSSSALAMTLVNGSSARAPMVMKNVGTGTVTITAQIDGASSTLTVGPQTEITLAWAVPRTSWLIVGQYDPGVLITDLTAATLASGTLLPAFDTDGTSRKTTAGALATFIGSGGGTYTLPTASTTVLGGVKVDGTTITIASGVISAAGSGGAAKFNIGVTQPGVTSNAQRLLVYKTNDVVTLPASLAGSSATALVAATASTAFVLAYIRSGTTTTIGTFTFAPAATVATISGVTIPTLVAGDVLVLTGPSTADASLADIGFSIVGTRA